MIENQISSRKRCFLTTTPTTTTTTTTKTHNIYNHCRLCFWAISTTMPTLLPLTHLISRNNVGVISSLRAVPYFRFIFFSHALCCCPRTFLRVSLSLFICFFFCYGQETLQVGRSVRPTICSCVHLKIAHWGFPPLWFDDLMICTMSWRKEKENTVTS